VKERTTGSIVHQNVIRSSGTDEYRAKCPVHVTLYDIHCETWPLTSTVESARYPVAGIFVHDIFEKLLFIPDVAWNNDCNDVTPYSETKYLTGYRNRKIKYSTMQNLPIQLDIHLCLYLCLLVWKYLHSTTQPRQWWGFLYNRHRQFQRGSETGCVYANANTVWGPVSRCCGVSSASWNGLVCSRETIILSIRRTRTESADLFGTCSYPPPSLGLSFRMARLSRTSDRHRD
jgi:hypothetical protein